MVSSQQEEVLGVFDLEKMNEKLSIIGLDKYIPYRQEVNKWFPGTVYLYPRNHLINSKLQIVQRIYIAMLSHPKTGSLIQVGTLRIRTVLTDRSTDRARHLKKEMYENC